MAELAAVSAHELLASRDRRAWSCTQEASTPNGLCDGHARLDELRRLGEALAWHQLVRAFDPPRAPGGRRSRFRAVASALVELVVTRSPSIAELMHASRSSTRTVPLS